MKSSMNLFKAFYKGEIGDERAKTVIYSLKSKGVILIMVLIAVSIPVSCPATAAGEPQVTVTSITENAGSVTVTGSTENLGARKVEIIVDNDLDRRFVAQNDADGNWTCTFEIPYNGTYRVQASIRDYSDFNAIRQTTPDGNYFEMENACVWGATVVKHTDGLYYMLFSTWDEAETFNQWNTYSQIGWAVSTKAGGPYIFQGMALDSAYSNIANAVPPDWGNGKLNMFHNPTLLYSKKDGRYYLYFVGKHTPGGSQKIGVAWAETPAGPWTVSDHPVIDTRADNFDNKYVCNPSVTEIEQANGEYLYYAVYRGNSSDFHASAYATASSPLGPFTQSDGPIMVNPNVDYSVEDCYIWYNNGKYYALAKDMSKGDLTGYTDGFSYALYESTDGIDWPLSENALAFPAVIPYASGDLKVSHLERSQLYLEDSIPFMICNATTVNGKSPYSANHTCNVQIPLLGVVMAQDTEDLQISDMQEKSVDKTALAEWVTKAQNAIEEYFTGRTWQALYSARRAGEILLTREMAEQSDVDFCVDQLQKLLAKRSDPKKIPTDIALQKPVTASSTQSGSAAANLTDGNSATCWTADPAADTVSIEIDLVGRYRLDSFAIRNDENVKKYSWKYYDGSEWKDAVFSANGTAGGIFPGTPRAEKLKLMITDHTETLSIQQIEVYGFPVSENIVRGKSVTASNDYGGNYTVVKAVDGSTTTRWATKNSVTGTVTYEIDLAGKYYLDDFRILQYRDRISAYSWQYFDGTTWRDGFAGTGTTGYTANTSCLHGSFEGNITAEKLRLNISAYSAAPSVWEIEVFGTLAYGNIALHKPTKASSVYSNVAWGTFPAAYLVDGSAATRWASKNDVTGVVSVEINLVGKYVPESFRITSFDARVTAYTWQYYDGEIWRDGFSTSTGAMEGTFAAGPAERLRLNITGYTQAPTLKEIEVYGSYEKCTGVSLDETSLDLSIGQRRQLTALVAPVDATDGKVCWLSTDPAVCTVSGGTVTAVGKGRASVIAMTNDGGYASACTVTVGQQDVPAFSLSIDEGIVGSMPESPGQYTLLWRVRQSAVNDALWNGGHDIHVMEYGIHYACSMDALTEYVRNATAGKDVSANSNVVTFVYASNEAGLTRIYSNYSFRIRGVARGRERSAVAFIKYERDGEMYTEYSAPCAVLTGTDGFIGGVGPIQEETDGLDD